ncbi:MAG TPA: hypothetical protein DCR55_09190 [Lentisphaeria bacterium]|nr:hypothetical protein [Lentisphaeria bacterium]
MISESRTRRGLRDLRERERLIPGFDRELQFPRTCRIRGGPEYALVGVVDVVFLLLIFIMLGSSLVFQTGITVRLPETVAQFEGVGDKLVITMVKEGQTYFNDQVVDLDKLNSQLKTISMESEGGRRPVIILKADRDRPYHQIVQLISMARSHNLEVIMVTKKAGE